jgi:type IV fimbrial biogenesis protein FimT
MKSASYRAAAQRGWTLLEMLVALAVLSVLAGLGTGSWSSIRRGLELQSQAHEVAAHIHQARSTAVASGQAIRLEVGRQAAGACLIVHTGAAGACRCDEQGAPVCDTPARTVATHWWPVSSAVTITANTPSMRFDPTVGTVTPSGTLRLSMPDGRALAQVVNVMGRARLCSPGGTVAGAAAC